MDDRHWVEIDHAYGVERIYGIGSEKFGEYHGGYLNFGWWEKAGTYIEAAEALVHKMAEILGLNDQSRLLDVACGMGAQDVYMHRHFGAEIDAVEILWNQVQVARERVNQAGMEGKVRIHHGTATQLPFKQKLEKSGFINASISKSGKYTIPGYFHEQCRKDTIKARIEIRGCIPIRAGFFIDYAVFQAFRRGLLEYIIVRSEKP